MKLWSKPILCLGGATAIAATALLGASLAIAGNDRPLFVSLGETTRAPIGWVDFCNELPRECVGGPTAPRDVVLSTPAWKDLVRINKWVNEKIKQMTDLDHWGVVEKWSYPDDGYGDREDYVLLKTSVDGGRLAREARSSPWSATAKARPCRPDGQDDKGEFILDNQNEDIVPVTQLSRQTTIAVRSKRLGFARRPARCHLDGGLALTSAHFKGAPRVRSRPHPPSQTGSRGRLSPKSRPHLFHTRAECKKPHIDGAF